MGPGDTVDGDLPAVEVFARDARPSAEESTIREPSERRGRVRVGIVIVTLVIGTTIVAVGLGSMGEGPGADSVENSQPGDGDPVGVDPFAGDAVFADAVRHSVGVVGETCCDRPAIVVADVSEVLGSHAPSRAADIAGIPGAAVFVGPGGSQLVALGAGGVAVVVAAEANRPFTPAELATLRDHVAVAVDETGAPRVVAVAPLAARSDGGPPPGPPPSPSAGRTTPLRTDQTTFVAGGADSGTVVAIDRWTGRLLWASTVGSAAFLDEVVGDVIVVATGPGRVTALDVFTGAPRPTGDSREPPPS